METEKILFFSIAIILLLFGLITMFTGQFYLLIVNPRMGESG